MPPSLAFLTNRPAAPDAVTPRRMLPMALVGAVHLAALSLMLWSEMGFVPKLIFCLTWGVLNFFWLALLRRPVISAAFSLAMIVILILVSRLKYDIIWMTANFLDLMIINSDTISFLLAAELELYRQVLITHAMLVPLLSLLSCIVSLRVLPRMPV